MRPSPMACKAICAWTFGNASKTLFSSEFLLDSSCVSLDSPCFPGLCEKSFFTVIVFLTQISTITVLKSPQPHDSAAKSRIRPIQHLVSKTIPRFFFLNQRTKYYWDVP